MNVQTKLLAGGAALLLVLGIAVLALAIHVPGDPASGALGGALLTTAAIVALMTARGLVR